MGTESGQHTGAVLDRDATASVNKIESTGHSRPELLRTSLKNIAAVNGFSLDFDPRKNLVQKDEERRRAVSTYFEKVQPGEKYQQPWDKPPLSEQEKESGWKMYWDTVPRKQKLERQKLILELRIKGLKDPEDLVHYFEKEYVGARYSQDIKPETPKNGYELARANDSYKTIKESFQNPEIVNAYKQIPNPGLATRRVHELGGQTLMYAHSQYEDVLLYRSLLERLGSIPEAKYRKVVDTLKEHPFVLTKIDRPDENKKLFDIVALIESGELTQQQINTLNTLDLLDRFTKDPNAKPEYLLGLKDKTIGEIFSSQQRYSDQVLVVQQIILEDINGRQNPYNKTPDRLGMTSIERLSRMPSEDLARMAKLIKQGWNLGSRNIHLLGDTSYGLTAIREKMTQAEAVLEKLENEDFKDFLSLLRHKGMWDQSDEQFMSLDNASLMNKAFEALTPEQLKQVELVSSLAEASMKTKNIVDKDSRNRELDYIWKIDEEGFKIQLYSLGRRTQETDLNNLEDPNQKIFWQFLGKIEDTYPQDRQLIFDYLLSNFDKTETFTKDGKATFALYYQYSDYLNTLSDADFAKKGIHLLFDYQRFESTSFLLKPEMCPDQLKDLANYLQGNPNVSGSLYRNIFSWNSYFKDGIAQESLVKMLAASNHTYDARDLLAKKEVLEAMPELSQKFWNKWMDLPVDVQSILARQVSSIGEITDDVIKNLEVTLTIIDQIDKSPSKEIHRLKDQLTGLLLTADDPLKAFEKVKAVFERNNLPTFGKIFSVFEILYPPSKIDQSITDSSFSADLSPVLVNAKIGKHQLRRYGIIYHDLLKVHIESANPSLYAFIKTFQEGEGLLSTFEKNGVTFFEDPANITAKHSLERFLDRMDVLYLSSLEGKRSGSHLETDTDLSQRLQLLKEKFGIKGDQRLSDRVSEMFVKPLGYTSLDQVLEKMESSKLEAHYRNIDYARMIAQDGIIKNLNAGDLVKGIEATYFNLILQNGSVAREYLGSSAGSDMTPYDTDTSMVLAEDLTGDLVGLIGNSISKDYGDVLLMIRDRGQFHKTSADNHQFLADKYELFNSRVHGERHFGIRTGIPSTEIDGVVARGTLLKDEARLDRLFFDIAQNGFYIPVTNESGNLIFTPEMFQIYRIQTQEVHNILNNPDFTASALIESLSKTEFIKNLYEAPSGVWEGYSLGQHTEMVGNQFEKYFSDFQSPLLNKNHLRVLLALHDIGKPLAFKETGSTHLQHDYTVQFLPRILETLEIDPKAAEIMIGVIDQDTLGDFLKGSTSSERTANIINDKAHKLGIPTSEFFKLIQTYYMSDAGSYTTDAGGEASLDHLFTFYKTEDNKAQIKFSGETQGKMDELVNLLSS